MKKILLSFLILSTLCFTSIQSSNALTNQTIITQVFEDGSYIEETIEESSVMTRSTITKTKTSTYRGADGTALWSVSVKGTFSYNGSTVTCTKSEVITNNYSSTWKLSNVRASKTGIKASASVTAKQYTSDGALSRTINKTVTLTCSPKGVLS